MSPEVSAPTLGALVLAAFTAGVIDAIAGGGGLITVPALLWAGIPPHFVFGTNKGSAVFGALASLVRFARGGLIKNSAVPLLFGCGFTGSLLGAALLLTLDPQVLKPLILVLLVLAAAFVAFGTPSAPSTEQPVPTVFKRLPAAGIALSIGAYDGFFGPGTGTFLIVLFMLLLQLPMQAASANAKVINFASNLAAVLLFASRGVVLWHVSLPMALGSFLGGLVGAQLAVTKGQGLIRKVLLLVVGALVVKLALEFFR